MPGALGRLGQTPDILLERAVARQGDPALPGQDLPSESDTGRPIIAITRSQGQPAGSVVSTPAAGRVWIAYAKTLKRGRTRLLPGAPGTVFAGSRVVTLARTGGRGE
jgi:hypothetical protein